MFDRILFDQIYYDQSAGIFRDVGSGSVSIAGAVSKDTTKIVGSGSVAIASTVLRDITKIVGEGTVTASGSITRAVSKIVGGASVAITGALTFQPGRIIEITMAPLRQWLSMKVRGAQYLNMISKVRQWLDIGER